MMINSHQTGCKHQEKRSESGQRTSHNIKQTQNRAYSTTTTQTDKHKTFRRTTKLRFCSRSNKLFSRELFAGCGGLEAFKGLNNGKKLSNRNKYSTWCEVVWQHKKLNPMKNIFQKKSSSK